MEACGACDCGEFESYKSTNSNKAPRLEFCGIASEVSTNVGVVLRIVSNFSAVLGLAVAF
jgi:hypothetical protein